MYSGVYVHWWSFRSFHLDIILMLLCINYLFLAIDSQ